MGKKVWIFNLPPKKTCTPTKWCLKGKNGKPVCYALRNNYLLSNVLVSLEERYKTSKRKDFSERVVCEIQKSYCQYFRIHSSGDFYNKEYIDKWINIVKQCPNTKFRTTTRRRDLKKNISRLAELKNIIVRESLDTDICIPIMGLKFAAISDCNYPRKKDIIRCKNNCEKCNYRCWLENRNVVQDEH